MSVADWLRGKRRWVWMTVALLLLGVACGPRVFHVAPFKQWFLDRATRKIQGRLVADQLRVRWWSPLVAKNVRLLAPDGEAVLEVPTLRGDRGLVRWLSWRPMLGEFVLQRPTVFWRIDGASSNFSQAFARVDEADHDALLPKDLESQPISATVRIVDGQLVFQADHERTSWQLGSLNAELGLISGDNNQGSSVVLQPGMLVDHVNLTPAVCHDLVKFVAPVLADVTWVEGALSVHSGGGRFPLAEPQSGELQGELVIHEVASGVGPFFQQLAELIDLPGSLQLVDDSHVAFAYRDGSFTHRGLKLHMGEMAVETEGDVGLDEELSLAAHIDFGRSPTSRFPALAGRRFTLPVEGTLRRPRLDWSSMLQDGQLRELASIVEERPLRNLLKQLQAEQSPRIDPDAEARPRLFGGRARRLLRNLLTNEPHSDNQPEDQQPDDS